MGPESGERCAGTRHPVHLVGGSRAGDQHWVTRAEKRWKSLSVVAEWFLETWERAGGALRQSLQSCTNDPGALAAAGRGQGAFCSWRLYEGLLHLLIRSKGLW